MPGRVHTRPPLRPHTRRTDAPAPTGTRHRPVREGRADLAGTGMAGDRRGPVPRRHDLGVET
ncbi:hypothetical protein DEF23_04455 [Marinitenerispora sediminis]|uniref:Uncharacterized protein n=1 Tax=Marinitenerispora sediminis TaxID=1931232 RepID=A0A368TAS6_9ACTN|nr:hypothetical protein DEF28_09370 [Marinitenerispora sediminis]RCV60465.1 hypothetical protein DEF23_04455 [Marinitenerispora sediminis]RCV61855.1 hypothetical protein DEF24_03235 [Marinitenerispora sediminis]